MRLPAPVAVCLMMMESGLAAVLLAPFVPGPLGPVLWAVGLLSIVAGYVVSTILANLARRGAQ